MELQKGRSLAIEIGVSYEWLMRTAKTGLIPSYRVGRSRRFKKSEVLEALREN